jgi:hypothetical protein
LATKILKNESYPTRIHILKINLKRLITQVLSLSFAAPPVSIEVSTAACDWKK